jgi:hypothetical protein
LIISPYLPLKEQAMSPSCRRRSLAAVAAACAVLGLGVPTAGATTTPAPGYEQFAGCPHPGEMAIATCFRTVLTGGVLQTGNVEIPIENPVTLSGGVTATGKFGASPKGGLVPVKQTVPGGLVGLTGLTWLEEFFPPEALALYATIELASTPSDPLSEPVSLPVKLHLTSTPLGKNCYLASNSTPDVLELITGTTSPPSPNVPITGDPGEDSLTGSGITDVTEGTYVDNSFAAYGANGCVLNLFGFPPISINSTIDSQAGLPSPAGENVAIFDFDTESVPAATVYP